LSSFFGIKPQFTPRPLLPAPKPKPKLPAPPGNRPYPGDNGANPPGPGWAWRGKPGSQPGDKGGNWYNQQTKESLRPDLSHPKPIGRHWDYKDHNGNWWRIFPDGTMQPKLPTMPPIVPEDGMSCPDTRTPSPQWDTCYLTGLCV